MNIQGLSKLSKEQRQHMFEVHKRHVDCNGLERKEDMNIIKVWVDKENCVCVKLSNGEWYHYYSDGTWA